MMGGVDMADGMWRRYGYELLHTAGGQCCGLRGEGLALVAREPRQHPCGDVVTAH